MKNIPIYPMLPESQKAQRIDSLPPVPESLLNEADQLINVQFNGSGMLLDHLRAAYGFLDKVNREFVATFTSCSKGCSHCCRMDVQITSGEAEYIALTTGIPHDPTAQLTKGNKTPCPFLSGIGDCTIYSQRPLFCRTYHALSAPKLCGTEGASIAQYGSMESNMGNILYRAFATWLHFQNQHVGGTIKDIRDFFPHDPNAMQHHITKYVS